MNPRQPQSRSSQRSSYRALLQEVKSRIRSAQYEALKAVNQELIRMYWDIGCMIVEKQKKEKWGKAIVEKLSEDLRREFPGVHGFSSSNLWRMRHFYEAYSGNEKLAPLVREIAWAHNIVILEQCRDDLEREFYIRMTRRMGWSKNVLIHQIENQTYEKMLSNQSNFASALPAPIKHQAKLALKDEYAFDFLSLGEEHDERELEQGLTKNVRLFLAEMGGVFAFLGNQYRLEVEGQEFFIDILLYHRRLKCLVAVELKTGEFKPEYVGKMQFYLAVLDDLAKGDDENPSLGIILCKSKSRTVVEYALKQSRSPLGIAQYKTFKGAPKNLKKELPTLKQMELLFKEI